MTPRDFVQCFVEEKRALLEAYRGQETAVGDLIAGMDLSEPQRDQLDRVLDALLTDVFYTILLGLDGAASIGAVQEEYELADEEGNVLTGGEIEAEAYEAFHGSG